MQRELVALVPISVVGVSLALWAHGASALAQTAASPAVTSQVAAGASSREAANGSANKSPQMASMKVFRVRSAANGCQTSCPEWISAEGMIDENTLPQFKKLLREPGATSLPILIDSGGGVVDEALAIGRLIRAKGMNVAVTKTMQVACNDQMADAAACKSAKARGVVWGRPRAYLARCASSCAFILAAGVHRYVGPMAFVGIHQLKTLQTSAQLLRRYRIETKTEWGIPIEVRRVLVSERRINEKTTEAKTPESAYVRVAKYFAEMGIAPEVMPILKSAPNSSIHWLTRAELKTTALATDTIDGEALTVGVTTRPLINSRVDAFKHFGTSPASPPQTVGR